MPDAKYASRAVARKLSSIEYYPEINQAAIKEMQRQVGPLQIDPRTGLAYRGVLVRHLILQWDYAGTRDLTNFLLQEVSVHIYAHVMEDYCPEHNDASDTKYGLIGYPGRGELDNAYETAFDEGLYRNHGKHDPTANGNDLLSYSLDEAEKCQCNPKNVL